MQSVLYAKYDIWENILWYLSFMFLWKCPLLCEIQANVCRLWLGNSHILPLWQRYFQKNVKLLISSCEFNDWTVILIADIGVREQKRVLKHSSLFLKATGCSAWSTIFRGLFASGVAQSMHASFRMSHIIFFYKEGR